jgi:hypothetical protein
MKLVPKNWIIRNRFIFSELGQEELLIVRLINKKSRKPWCSTFGCIGFVYMSGREGKYVFKSVIVNWCKRVYEDKKGGSTSKILESLFNV